MRPGNFCSRSFLSGEYKLTVNCARIQTGSAIRVIDACGRQTAAEFSLELGEQSEIVTVTGESRLVASGIGRHQGYDRAATGNRPSAQRTQFHRSGGIDARGDESAVGHARVGAAADRTDVFGILGQRSGHNLYLVDGVTVTDESFNNLVLSPSVDDIQEVNVNQTSYDAEFGGKSGGVINVITKSGSNQFHGSAVRICAKRYFRREELFRFADSVQAAFQAESVRRVVRRPDSKGQNIFLPGLRGSANPQVSNPVVHRSDRCGTRRQFHGIGYYGQQSGHRDPFLERYDPHDRSRSSGHAGKNSHADFGEPRATI